MTPKDKARAAGTSASSFMDLGAELERQKQEFTKNKAAGKPVGRVEGPAKRAAKWAKQNAGVQERAARDTAVFEEPGGRSSRYEDGRVVLERKAQRYELLKKGRTGGYSEKQYEELLVDFVQKSADHYESDSDDVDESLTVPSAPHDHDGEDDPLVEYVDELGRTRTVRRSQVPRDIPASRNDEGEGPDADAIYNPVNHFPVYEHSLERQAQILAEAAESPLNVHYDSSKEIRDYGPLHINFSSETTARDITQREIRGRHEETKIARRETGAEDKRLEGMRADEAPGSMPAKSLAMEKRKRELEERKKQLEARKRKKVSGGEELVPESSATSTTHGTPVPVVAADPTPGSKPKEAARKETTTVKDRPRTLPNGADAFLAQLEQEMLER